MNIFKVATKIALAMPVLPVLGGVFSNRRKGTAKLCAPADVTYNISDAFYRWTHRIPGDAKSAICRDKDGSYNGSINREP